MPRAKKGEQKQAPRPKIPIDWDLVDQLLQAGSPGTEIAARLGITHETLYERTVLEKGSPFSSYAARKRSSGDSLLRNKQFTEALKGNTQLLIRLGECRLGQGKQADVDTAETRTHVIIEQEVQRRLAAALQQRGISESDLPPEQPLSYQGPGGEEDTFSDELGTKGVIF